MEPFRRHLGWLFGQHAHSVHLRMLVSVGSSTLWVGLEVELCTCLDFVFFFCGCSLWNSCLIHNWQEFRSTVSDLSALVHLGLCIVTYLCLNKVSENASLNAASWEEVEVRWAWLEQCGLEFPHSRRKNRDTQKNTESLLFWGGKSSFLMLPRTGRSPARKNYHLWVQTQVLFEQLSRVHSTRGKFLWQSGRKEK